MDRLIRIAKTIQGMFPPSRPPELTQSQKLACKIYEWEFEERISFWAYMLNASVPQLVYELIWCWEWELMAKRELKECRDLMSEEDRLHVEFLEYRFKAERDIVIGELVTRGFSKEEVGDYGFACQNKKAVMNLDIRGWEIVEGASAIFDEEITTQIKRKFSKAECRSMANAWGMDFVDSGMEDD